MIVGDGLAQGLRTLDQEVVMDEFDSPRNWLEDARSRLSKRQSAAADMPTSAHRGSGQSGRSTFGWCAYEVWLRQIREPRAQMRSSAAD